MAEFTFGQNILRYIQNQDELNLRAKQLADANQQAEADRMFKERQAKLSQTRWEAGYNLDLAQYQQAEEKNFNAENAAIVAIDPKTGGILTMVGSRNYFDPEIDGAFNVTLAKRQPGSTFKPFVYAEAFKKGYTPETVVLDVKTQFAASCRPDDLTSENNCYSPDNYDNLFRALS